MKLEYTRHAQRRMQQRGISGQDVDLIVAFGTMVRPGLYMLRNRDADREIQEHKRRIEDLERNRGRAAVVAEDTVVTCYRVFGSAGRRAVRRDTKGYRRRPSGHRMSASGRVRSSTTPAQERPRWRGE